MKERPIIFTHNILRIIDGTKTQTRRTRGLNIINAHPDNWHYIGRAEDGSYIFRDILNRITFRCPFGVPGDRLWVREAWQDYCPIWAGAWCGHGTKEGIAADHRVIYRADNPESWIIKDTPEDAKRWGRTMAKDPISPPKRWRSSMLMPRWASRITLEITGVRVERLQEMTMFDMDAEGTPWDPENGLSGDRSRLAWFREFWDSLNARRGHGWALNPWVWRIEFRRLPA